MYERSSGDNTTWFLREDGEVGASQSIDGRGGIVSS